MVNNNQVIDNFEFWPPVTLDLSQIPKKDILSEIAIKIGSWADQYVSLGQKLRVVEAKHLKDGQLIYTEKEVLDIPLWKTASKAATFFLTLLILPAIALLAKFIFKRYLNARKSPNELILEKQFGNTKIVLLSGNLLNENTGAIVNPANPSLEHLGGVCGKIYDAAGDAPFNECAAILKENNAKSLKPGGAVMTTAGKLENVSKIIHAVAPMFDNVKLDNVALAECYTQSLELITKPKKYPTFISPQMKNVQPSRTVAFPSMGTGLFFNPLDEAAKVSLNAIKQYINQNPDDLDEVRFVFLPLDLDPQKTSEFYVKALEGL